MKKKLIELLKTLKVLTDERVAEVETALEKAGIKDDEPTPTPIDTSKITDPSIRAIIDGLSTQVRALEGQNQKLLDTIGREQQNRDAAAKAAQEQAKKDQEQKVSTLVAQAIKDQKISKAKEDWLKKFAERDLDAATEWVKEAPVDKHATPPKSPDKPADKNGSQKTDRLPGPLGSVNQDILAKVVEQAQAPTN